VAILWRTLVNAVAIAAAAYVVPGIHWGGVDYGMGDAGRYLSLALTGLALGLVNAIVRPILALVAMPITCLTLGLFTFVINALMLLLITLIPFLGFTIDGFLPALIGSIVISLVSFVLSRVLPD
jgi:putative membrane protein